MYKPYTCVYISNVYKYECTQTHMLGNAQKWVGKDTVYQIINTVYLWMRKVYYRKGIQKEKMLLFSSIYMCVFAFDTEHVFIQRKKLYYYNKYTTQ